MLYHHISLLTRHKEENIHFYTEILGLRFVKNTVNQENYRMPHLFYGDYQGSAGSVITFFAVPHLGHRYDNREYLAEIGLNLPKNSLSYWQERLEKFGVSYEVKENTIILHDPDDVLITLTETQISSLEKNKVVLNEIPADRQIIDIRAIHFYVENPAATIDFFEKLLDWSFVDNRYEPQANHYVAILQSQSTEKTRMGRGSIDHIAFAVENDESLEALHQKALSQNWQVEKLITRGYFKSLYIREPGGIRVEFATLKPGFTLDEDLEHLGETLALPPFLADQRTEIEAHLYPDK